MPPRSLLRRARLLCASRRPASGSRGPATQLLGARRLATRSASAVHADAKRQAAAPASDAANDMLLMLEQSIAERLPSEALAYYNCLQSPPSGLTSQKLAILLAKQDSLHQTRRAFEILQAVYGSPDFEVDDYTQLASIYIVDACLRQKLISEALEIVNHAHMNDISLDLPAYDRLLRALVDADDLSRARLILTDVVGRKQVVLTQQTFQPLLMALMERGEYDAVIDVIDHGRKNDVLFTFETYDPLVELGEKVDDSEDEELWNQLERFMSYINEAVEDDGLTDMLEDDDDDDGIAVEVGYDDDDDDDDEDFDEDFDDHKY